MSLSWLVANLLAVHAPGSAPGDSAAMPLPRQARGMPEVFRLLAGTTASPQGGLAPSSSSCSGRDQGCRCSARNQENIILG